MVNAKPRPPPPGSTSLIRCHSTAGFMVRHERCRGSAASLPISTPHLS